MSARTATTASPRRRRAPSEPRASLGPDDWISAATALLASKGVDAVRVDVLAKRIGVTRGSFYWHFKDRDDLLSRVLQAWRDGATEQVISRFERQGATPLELMREVMSLPFRGRSAVEAASVELAIRAWARHDEMARQRLDEVDAQRLSYIAQGLTALGFPIAEARLRAFALYGWQVAESLLQQHGGAAQRAERRAFMEQLLLGKATS
ncbi:TetR/AcrR family transcriptional regulator [Caldimonas sp. KR1-144]|uniref:TetR/AcrR family transcriptional regulator n=1 Tax=Caldimonas sp. KR1-144 TaxID=3400911 RepID=UPI003C0D67E0